MNPISSNCPKCGAEIKTTGFHDLHVEHCPNCHGIFLDFSEIGHSSIHRFADHTPPRKDMEDLDKITIHCPKCSVEMHKKRPLSKLGLLLDTCPQCKGIWFDQNELARYRKPFKMLFGVPKKFLVSLYCQTCAIETKYERETSDPFKCPLCGQWLSFLAKAEVYTRPNISRPLLSLILSVCLLSFYFVVAMLLFHNLTHAMLCTVTVGAIGTFITVRLVVYKKFSWSSSGGSGRYGLVRDFDI